MRGFTKYLLLIIFLFLIAEVFFFSEKEKSIAEIQQNHIAEAKERFLAAQRAFDKLSQSFYNERNDYLARLMHLANDVDNVTRETIREDLLSRLFPIYHNSKLFGLIQFQIHTKDGLSFLRFNHQDVYNDDLKKIRYSIRTITRNYLYIKGFEAGRFVDGLRYLYPLFYDGEFVGSYEWVWDHETLVRELQKIYGGDYGILIRRESLEGRMEQSVIRELYDTFMHCSDYLYQKTAYGLYRPHFVPKLQELSEEHRLCELWKRNHDFSIPYRYDNRNQLATFIVIRDIGGKPYGYFIALEDENRLNQAERLFAIESLFLLFVLILLLGILYRTYREKTLMRTLLDSQKDLILLTNGRRLLDANKAFLDFCDVKDIHEFVRRFKCVCELFIEADGFLQKEQEGLDWLQYLVRHPEDENRVLMYDQRKEEDRIYSISFNRFGSSDLYVITLRDVTETEREKMHFRIEALMDHLTGIYNKRAFEHYLKDKIRDLNYYRHTGMAVVMFDIDDFKSINDRYGHQWGDEILRELTALVRRQIRKSDFFARWGGDEFMIIMDGVDLKEAATIIENLRVTIHSHDFHLREPISSSFGITDLRADDSMEGVVDRVDKLLYRAKSRGKNRVVTDNGF